jgi:hypothetical protein
MTSETYETLNKAWKQTCKVIFGEDIGDLKEYEGWLWERNRKEMIKRKSASGKDVYSAVTTYCKDARFISFSDIDYTKRFEPLGINQVKDIDSIVEALKERWEYTGNVILGNSINVEGSSNVYDSSNILNTACSYNSEYVAYSYTARETKYTFGINTMGGVNFMIESYYGRDDSRCLGCWYIDMSSDCYYCSNIENVQNALFTFNVKGKRNIIGNIELPKDKFLALKSKLVAELREKLKKDKSLPSLVDMVSADARIPKKPNVRFPDSGDEPDDKPVERAFREITKIMLGKELSGMVSYEGWLMRNVRPVERIKSVLTGRTVYCSAASPHTYLPKARLAKEDETRNLGEAMKMDAADVESLAGIEKAMWKIAIMTPETRLGTNINSAGIPNVKNCMNCYGGSMYAQIENAGFCCIVRNGKYVFGSSSLFNSSFCLRSNQSTSISRCFEVDGCTDCSDLYYSHNCENVHDSMFCFNVKNVRNAIGNGVLPLDKYKAVKKSLLEQIVNELEKKKTLKWDIYNIGCAK